MDQDLAAAGNEINHLAADSLQEQHKQRRPPQPPQSPLPRGPGRPFQPGRSGNPHGRRRGSRNRATVLAEALLSGQAEEVVRRVIGAALEGDAMAQRLCMERIIAPRRLERVHFAMPVLATGADAAKALAAVAQAVAKGELAPAEAGDLAALVQSFVHSLETQELETRLQAVEKAAAQARTQSRW